MFGARHFCGPDFLPCCQDLNFLTLEDKLTRNDPHEMQS